MKQKYRQIDIVANVMYAALTCLQILIESQNLSRVMDKNMTWRICIYNIKTKKIYIYIYINKTNNKQNIRVASLIWSKCRKQNEFNSEQVTAGRCRLHADGCNEESRGKKIKHNSLALQWSDGEGNSRAEKWLN